jgi:hypothetical protein
MKIKALILAISTLMASISFAQSTTPTATPASAASASSKTAALPSKSIPKTAPNSSTSTSTMTEAAGGGADKVWVNAKSNTYHCPGTKYYGKTKSGEYLTVAAAKAKGAHADHGKECGK